MTAFWDIAPYNLIALMVEAVRAFETSPLINEATRRYIPEGYHLHTRRHENLRSHSLRVFEKRVPRLIIGSKRGEVS
jgi:hypothetical protein